MTRRNDGEINILANDFNHCLVTLCLALYLQITYSFHQVVFPSSSLDIDPRHISTTLKLYLPSKPIKVVIKMPPLPIYNDEKAPLGDHKHDTNQSTHELDMHPPKRTRLITRLVAAIFIVYFAIWPLAELAAYNVRKGYRSTIPELRILRKPLAHESEQWQWKEAVVDQKGAGASGKTLVPLEAHIMSKCPDARDCLQKLVLPTMQRVSDKVNFTLSYIGTYVIIYSYFYI